MVEEIPVVSVENLTKRFPGVAALDGVSLEVRPGEIHAVLGENGAGKSTLAKILYGIYSPDGGRILIEGHEVSIASPRDAMKLGIAMVSQRPQLVEELNVAENIALSLEEIGILTSMKRVYEYSHKLVERFGLDVDVTKPVWMLSYTQKQMVELLRALAIEAKLLILDEVTTYLPKIVKKKLYGILKSLKFEGRGILFITHKIGEALDLADRITVLRRGKVVATFTRGSVDGDALRKAMFGERYAPQNEIVKKAPQRFEEKSVLNVEGLVVLGDHGELAVNSVSFNIRRGEVLSIAGIAGNGQRELVEAIAGFRKPVKGRVLFEGVDISREPPFKRALMGLAFIPEDPFKQGVAVDLSLAENMALKLVGKMFITFEESVEVARKAIDTLSIAAPSVRTPVGTLSGGNVQKVVVARELMAQPRVLVAYNPTRMLDEASASKVRRMIRSLADKGAAVLLISEDVEEAVELGDRVAVMSRGQIVGLFSAGSVNVEMLEKLMAE